MSDGLSAAELDEEDSEYNVDKYLAEFLYLNLIAHEPCHDFSPTK